MSSTIAVTGATGLIGRRLVDRLLARGDRVVALVRGAGRRRLPAAVEQREWSAESAAADLRGCDAVVHLAGAPVAKGRWTAARKRAIEESRILGTRSVVAGIRAASGVRTLVSASGIDIHGDTGPRPIDETTSFGRGFLASLGVRWEGEALLARSHGARVVLLRTGLVLAREGGALPAMLPTFRLGLGGPLGNGHQSWAWIHIEDEVGLILHALDREEVEGPMLCVSPRPVEQRAFARSLGRALHRPAILPAPAFALRLLLGEMADLLLASHRATPAVALRTGYRFRFEDLDEALADLLGSYFRSAAASSS